MDAPSLLFDNRFDDATPEASGTASGNVLNLRDWRPYTWWTPDSLPATVRVDSGSARKANYCLVWGHNLGTHGATLEVRGSTDGWVGSDVLIASLAPADDEPFLLQFDSEYAHHGIRITGTTAPSLSIVAIGEALQIPASIGEGFDPLKREMKGEALRSAGGNPLGTVFDYEEWQQPITFELLTWDWLRTSWVPAWKAHLRSTPCVFAWDPVSHPDELHLVKLGSGYETPHRAGSYADLSFEMSGAWQ